MITFICLFFPGILSVWLYEKVSAKQLTTKQWFYFYTTAVLFVNLFCFLVKRFLLGTGSMHMFNLYEDITPSAASNYMIMAIPAAMVWAVSFWFLPIWGSKLQKRVTFLIRDNISFFIKDGTYRGKEPSRYVCVACCLLTVVSFLCFFSARWYVNTYGQIGFDSVLFTLLASLDGTSSDLVRSYFKLAAIPALLCSLVFCLLFLIPVRRQYWVCLRKKLQLKIYPVLRRGIALGLGLMLSASLLVKAAVDVELIDFINDIVNRSVIYQEQFKDPAEVSVVFPEEKRNLIYIYLESMETSFFSEKEGGALPYNTIPELYALAEENINFSQNDRVGGFGILSGTTWTAAALVAQTAGIPLKTPIGVRNNHYGEDGVFLPGVTSINNILKDNGYRQVLMFGSHASFGGRSVYFGSHGIDEIFDYTTAISDGIIPEGYYVWWGMEDSRLYDYAKQVLPEIATSDEPFAFTMLTADTHHIDGYLCPLCQQDYNEQYENVYRCASRQISDFLAWLQQQDFYQNTTVILVGDHASMDGEYFSRNVSEYYERRIYNCILNSAIEPVREKNREFTAVDMFPTTLAALGCTIDGDRLGLGTNLFSDRDTLAEELGKKEFDQEISKTSNYYINNFY